MPDSYFPLRWESTGDQWWYASPIDWAAANGHYDLVRELLHLDTNLLIKLTSLRRIRRLETVWDDDARFFDAAKCRSFVARSLLLECEAKGRKNTLIRAGYGGWLLYTAASAGDVKFVQELLERDPLLVFGEGEYGVTDILYAAARSKNSGVFKLLFDFAVSPRCSMGGGGVEIEEEERFGDGSPSVFRWEMVNRAVHAAARGGNLEILRELLGDCSGLLTYRDAQGSTVLHAASGRGQVEVVKDLVASFDVINSRDNQGNTSLHVAAFRGHLSVVEALLRASPSSSSSTNNAGDTFFHMAVAGFRTTGFHRLDRQMELMKQLIHGTIVNIQEIINIKNNDGRTVLHMAMIGTVHSDLVELLMTVRSVNLNTRDVDGLTPLDLLSQRPRTASSEILIKQLTFAGGISGSKDQTSGSATSSRMQGIGNSPGTSFRIPDAEIFLYTGIGAVEDSGRPSSCSSASKSELSLELSETKQSPMNSAARRLKILLGWPRRRVRKNDDREDTPTPLRQRCSQASSLLNNKRALAMPSPATKKFTAGLMQGVIQAMPHPGFPSHSPSGSFSMSSTSSPASEKQKGVYLENEGDVASCSKASSNGGAVANVAQRSGFVNSKVMNRYLCFGAQGLAVEDSVHGRRPTRIFKRFLLSVA